MAKGKAQKPVDTYRVNSDAAAAAASTASPQTTTVSDYKSKLWDIYTSKEKFELSKLPNANVLLPLYQAAKEHSDTGRIGKGLAYGEGYNPNLIASIDEQNQNEREIEAAGQLEQRVSDTFAGLPNDMLQLGEIDQNRRDNNFSRVFGIYNTEAQRQAQKDAKPKWWQSLLGGIAGAGTSLATSGISSLTKKRNPSGTVNSPSYGGFGVSAYD